MIDPRLGDKGEREERGDRGATSLDSPHSPHSPHSSQNPEPAWKRHINWSEGNSQGEISLEGDRPSSPLLDPEEIDEFSVSSSSFANPTTKLALVFGCVFLAVTLLWFLFSGMKAPLKADSESLTDANPETEAKQSSEPLAVPEDSSVGKLKTELALSQQEQQLAQLKVKQGEAKSQKGQKPSPPKKTPPPQPVRVASVPTPPRPTPPPLPAPPRRLPPPPVPPVRVAAPPPPPVQPETPTVNPHQAWVAAAQLGSYGPASGASSPPHPVGNREIENPAAPNRMAPHLGYQPASRGSHNSIVPPLPPSPDEFAADELPVLLGEQSSQGRLPIGQSFRARLADSLVWDSTVQEIGGMAELLEPLSTRDGEELAPAGSLVVVKLANPSGAGVVKLEAQAVIVLGSEEDLEISLPPNALLVRGPDGMPLMAEAIDRGGEREGGINWGGLLLDAAQTAATFSGTSGNSYQDLYRFQRLQSLYDRHFGQPSNPSYRPFPRQGTSAWVLPAGREVELYVNQSFEFGIRNSEFGRGNSEERSPTSVNSKQSTVISRETDNLSALPDGHVCRQAGRQATGRLITEKGDRYLTTAHCSLKNRQLPV